MTRKLEELFDLPPSENPEQPTMEEALAMARDDEEKITALVETADKIDAALPSVRDMETSDKELDTLAELATDHFKELMELGMNVEPRLASEIFGSASNLLGHAITARTAKIDKKLKVVQLQIQKARLDFQKSKVSPPESDDTGDATEIDRNTLLAEIMAMKADQKDK